MFHTHIPVLGELESVLLTDGAPILFTFCLKHGAKRILDIHSMFVR